MQEKPSIFQFDWDEARGLDLHVVEWEARAAGAEFNLTVLEMSQALYSAFIELRKIRKIMAEGRPGVEHSFYQVRFELFAHNHFLSIATTRVVKILQLGWPSAAQQVVAVYGPLIERVTKYRNSLEHQTEIGKQKSPPTFLNNLDSNGFFTNGNSVRYMDIEQLLNDIMARLEATTGEG